MTQRSDKTRDPYLHDLNILSGLWMRHWGLTGIPPPGPVETKAGTYRKTAASFHRGANAGAFLHQSGSPLLLEAQYNRLCFLLIAPSRVVDKSPPRTHPFSAMGAKAH